jgi:adenine-specific DNA glycosylase
MTDFTDSPLKIDQSTYIAKVQHVFSHFKLVVSVHSGKNTDDTHDREGEWVDVADLSNYALPTLMQKILLAAKIK